MTIIKYLDVNAAGGGNGNIATPYNTWANVITGITSAFNAATEDYVIEVVGAGVDSTSADYAFTDSSGVPRTLTVRASGSALHNGTRGSGYRNSNRFAFFTTGANITVVLENLASKRFNCDPGSVGKIILRKCYNYDLPNATSNGGFYFGSGTIIGENLIAVGAINSDGYYAENNNGAPTVTLTNCIAMGNGRYGFNRFSGTMNLTNCYSGGNTTEAYNGTITRVNCAHDTATVFAGSTASTAYTTANFTNVTAGSEDPHLVSGSALIGAGVGPAANSLVPLFDFEGTPRGATYTVTDIGPDQRTAAAVFEQEGFRWRRDDGSESSATWFAAQDTDITIGVGTNVRLRDLINATNDPASLQYRLDYRKSTDSVYVPVLTASPSAPAWVSSGTEAAGTAGVTVVWPTHQKDDIGLLIIESCGGEAATLSTAAGFVAVSDSPSSTGATTSGTRITCYWCRATSSAQASPVVADPGDHVYARIVPFRGCIAEGNPWNVTAAAQKASASTSASAPSVTTTVPNCLIVNIISRDNDASGNGFSAEANASLASLAERADGGTGNGNGGGFAVYTGTLAVAGASGTTTATVTSSINASLTIALRPQTTPIIMAASSNITASGENTTAQLTAPSGKSTSDFVAGRIQDDENPADAVNITADDYSEFEWCIKAQVPAANGDIYQFRASIAGLALDTYTLIAQLTVGGQQSADFSASGSFGASFAAIAATVASLNNSFSAGTTISSKADAVGVLNNAFSANATLTRVMRADRIFSAGFGAGESFSGQADALGTLTDGIGAGSSLSARAAALAVFEAGLSADDSEVRQLAAFGLLADGVSADSAVSALADAIAAMLAGVAAGEVWAARVQAAALLAASGEFGAEFSGDIGGAKTGVLLAGTTASAEFIAAAQTLATLSAGAGFHATIAAIATAAGQLSAGVNLTSTFDYLTGNSSLLQAGVSVDAVFAISSAAVASLIATVGAQALFAAVATTSAAFSAGASFSDAWNSVGGISDVLPPRTLHVDPRRRTLRVGPRDGTFTVQPRNRSFRIN